MRVNGEPAYILHHRNYGETSLILELFSRTYGRVCVVAKGARKARSNKGVALEPFQPMLAGWVGKGELKTLTDSEPGGMSLRLAGESLYCGFYLNELLLKLLHRDDPHEVLFDKYHQAVTALMGGNHNEIALRLFEKNLLIEIGYSLVLDHEVESGQGIIPDQEYVYIQDSGPHIRDRKNSDQDDGWPIKGAALLALAEDRLNDNSVLRQVKGLMRTAISYRLEGKQLKSRELLISVMSLQKSCIQEQEYD